MKKKFPKPAEKIQTNSKILINSKSPPGNARNDENLRKTQISQADGTISNINPYKPTIGQVQSIYLSEISQEMTNQKSNTIKEEKIANQLENNVMFSLLPQRILLKSKKNKEEFKEKGASLIHILNSKGKNETLILYIFEPYLDEINYEEFTKKQGKIFQEQEDLARSISTYIISPRKKKEFNHSKFIMASEFQYKLYSFIRLNEYIEGQIPLRIKFKICYQITDLIISIKPLEKNNISTTLFFGNLYYSETNNGIKYLPCNIEISQMLHSNSLDLQVINGTTKGINVSKELASFNSNYDKNLKTSIFSIVTFLFDILFNKYEKISQVKEKETIKEEELESKLEEIIGNSLNTKHLEKLKEYLTLFKNNSSFEINLNEIKSFLSEIDEDFETAISNPKLSSQNENLENQLVKKATKFEAENSKFTDPSLLFLEQEENEENVIKNFYRENMFEPLAILNKAKDLFMQIDKEDPDIIRLMTKILKNKDTKELKQLFLEIERLNQTDLEKRSLSINKKQISNNQRENQSKIDQSNIYIYNNQQSMIDSQSGANYPSDYIVTNDMENNIKNEESENLRLIDFDLNTKKLEDIIQKNVYNKIKCVMVKYFESRSNYFCGETQSMNIHSFRTLMESLLKLPNLIHLYLSNVTSTNEVEKSRQVTSLTEFLLKRPNLKTLDLYGCEFTETDMQNIMKTLYSLVQLEDLRIGQNMIHDQETDSILNKLLQCTENLKILDLSFTGVNFSSLFVDSLNLLTNLQELYLNGNNITDDNFREIEQLRIKLTTFSIRKNKIGRNSRNILKHFFEFQTILKNFNISGNRINDECIEEISKSIKTNDTIEVLNFSHNNIEDQGAVILMNIASNLYKLNLLDYSYNLVSFIQVEQIKNRKFEINFEINDGHLKQKGILCINLK